MDAHEKNSLEYGFVIKKWQEAIQEALVDLENGKLNSATSILNDLVYDAEGKPKSVSQITKHHCK